MLAAVMSLLVVNETLPTPDLNCHPLGRVRIRVLLFPTAKSVVAASVRTMFPKSMNAAPLVELRHVSAETSLPPAGSVIITSPSTAHDPAHKAPIISPNRSDARFILRIFARSLLVQGSRKRPRDRKTVFEQQLTCHEVPEGSAYLKKAGESEYCPSPGLGMG